MKKKIKVHCAFCKKELNRDDAYLVKRGKKNVYYCNKEHSAKRTSKELFYEELGNILQSTNTIIYKELNMISEIHTYEKMNLYLKDNKDFIINVMSNKNFYNDFARCKYFLSIIRNNIGDYRIPTPEIKKEVQIEMYESKYKPKEQKKGLDSLLEDLLGE